MLFFIISIILGIITIISFPLFWPPIKKFCTEHFGLYIIKDKQIKNYLVKAKHKLKKKEYESCAIDMAKAFELFANKIRKNYQQATGQWVSIIGTIESAIHRNIIDLDIIEYKKFTAWMPLITTFESGRQQVRIKRSYTTPDTPSNLIFCLKFIINGILKNRDKI